MSSRFLHVLAAALCAVAIPAWGDDPSEEDMVKALTPKPAAPLTRGLARGTTVRSAPEGKLAIAVQFEYASARITPASAATLTRLAAAMKAEALADRHFRIEGHTDSSGNPLNNTRLSGRRAESVRNFLAAAGVDQARLSTIGLGSAIPADAANPEGAVNRRVVILSLEQAQVVAAKGSAASVQRLVGQARVKRGDQETPLQPGTRLREGDVVTTDSTASALVRMDDGAQLLVREGSRLEVGKLQIAGDASGWAQALNLVNGAVRFLTGALGKSRPQAVRLTTYTSTIGIRGTDFDVVVVLPDGSSMREAGTYVRVNQGAVALGATDGSKVDVGKDEQAFAGTPRPATRGGKREPAAVRLSAPTDVFRSGAFDELLQQR